MSEALVKGFLCDEIEAGKYAERLLHGRKAYTFAIAADHPIFRCLVKDSEGQPLLDDARQAVGKYIELGMPDFEGIGQITNVSAPRRSGTLYVRDLTVVEHRAAD